MLPASLRCALIAPHGQPFTAEFLYTAGGLVNP